MASSLRNLSSILMDLSRNSRTRIFIASLLFLAVFSYFSATFAGDSPAGPAGTLASRLRFSHSSIPSLSSISPFSTHFITVPGNATKLVALSLVSPFDVTHYEKNSSKPEHQHNNVTTTMIQDMSSCNIFDGTWVLDDDSDPFYQPGSCPFVDNAFNCIKNGRPDSEYQRFRWRPNECQIPRFNGKIMLEILREKRLVFVGDSLNRNMWESLVCALRESLEDKKRVFEVSGRQEFRTQGFYSIRFPDYNCSIEFFRSPFLVQESKFSFPNGIRKETLHLDVMHKSSYAYQDADIIVFNTGHWWTHEKTSEGKNYYQVGSYVYQKLSVSKAYWRALNTWANWVDSNINSSRTKVFFRGYSASHYKGGQWSSGGSCDGETAPITNEVHLATYPHMMNILESVLNKMKTPVFYLNITRMTDYRKDGHPSIYREPGQLGMFQDCSHWCLPGVPDAWNELLYATLIMSYR